MRSTNLYFTYLLTYRCGSLVQVMGLHLTNLSMTPAVTRTSHYGVRTTIQPKVARVLQTRPVLHTPCPIYTSTDLSSARSRNDDKTCLIIIMTFLTD